MAPQGIVSWLKKRTGPPAKIIEAAEDVEKMKESTSVVVVGFFGESEDALVKAFEDAATKADDKIEFALVRSADIAKKLNEKVQHRTDTSIVVIVIDIHIHII